MSINYKYVTTIILTIGVTLLVCNLFNGRMINNMDSLNDSLRVREKKIIALDSISKVLAIDKVNSVNVINKLTHNADSLKKIISKNDGKINNTKTKIIILNNQYNEKINSVNSWNSNNYSSFFADYFKGR
jgi:hypothetical protein